MVELTIENKEASGLEVKDKFEAGLVLTGAEVKSLRQKQARLAPSFVRISQGEPRLLGLHIGHYSKSGGVFPPEDRVRKILLNRGEIDRLSGLLSQKGMICVPLKIYLRKGLFKVELGVGRRLKKWQKKDKIIERQEIRDTDRILKSI